MQFEQNTHREQGERNVLSHKEIRKREEDERQQRWGKSSLDLFFSLHIFEVDLQSFRVLP